MLFLKQAWSHHFSRWGFSHFGIISRFFTVQLSRFLPPSVDSCNNGQLDYIITISTQCQHFFSSFYNFRANAEGGIWTLAPLLTTCTLSRGVPSASLGTSAYQLRWQRKKNSYEFFSTGVTTKRRGWDSNPRALADKRFSRPPRYDHFDTSPYLLSTDSDICALRISAELILPSISSDVNHKFAFFHHKVTIQSRCGWRVVNS